MGRNGAMPLPDDPVSTAHREGHRLSAKGLKLVLTSKLTFVSIGRELLHIVSKNARTEGKGSKQTLKFLGS